MEKTGWTELDNASKMFMAAMNSTDTKVFRLSSELYDVIDPELLQQAVDLAYDDFPLFHFIIRRGIFWYYLEESDLRPVISEDNRLPHSALYDKDHKNLLFRVVYYDTRIHLEVFHAISDGTGAVWFMERIVFNYLKLLYPEEFKDDILLEEKGSLNQQLSDNFERYFAQDNKLDLTKINIGKAIGKEKKKRETVYKVRGIKTEDKRMRIVEATMPVSEVLAVSKAYGVSLTVFLTALFLLAVYEYAPKKDIMTISVTVPINLRNYFKSGSARNFFSTMIISYTFDGENDDLILVSSAVKEQFDENMIRDRIIERGKLLVSLENNILLKLVPRPLKDFALKIINRESNKRITVATSNLGIIKYPDEIEKHIKNMYVHTAAIRPQFVSLTFKGILSIGFTSPFVETEIQKNFIRFLTDRGINVRVAANRASLRSIKKDTNSKGNKSRQNNQVGVKHEKL